MKIVLSGGGTGGHIYPALALREYILRVYPEAEFLYIGTEKGLESKIVRERDIPFKTVRVQGIRRSLSLENFKTIYYAIDSIGKAKQILKKYQPDVVIGTGGYVCGPVLYAAAKLNIPTIIHEQNSVAGVTNKLLARYVNKIAICMEDVIKDFSKYSNKVVLTGNPRGQELVESTSDDTVLEAFGLSASKPTVLVFGGSRGALNLNNAIVRLYAQFADQNYQLLVVTGRVHYEDVLAQLPSERLANVTVIPYLDKMMDVLKNVDLVVCRSGATTLAELTALGVASILIPSPYVTNNHQEKNAQSLVDKNAAVMLLENQLGNDSLFVAIDTIMNDSDRVTTMAQNAYELGIRDASKRLWMLIQSITK